MQNGSEPPSILNSFRICPQGTSMKAARVNTMTLAREDTVSCRRSHKGQRSPGKPPKKISAVERRVQELEAGWLQEIVPPVVNPTQAPTRPLTLVSHKTSLHEWALRFNAKYGSGSSTTRSEPSMSSDPCWDTEHGVTMHQICHDANHGTLYTTPESGPSMAAVPITFVERQADIPLDTYTVEIGSGNIKYSDKDFSEYPSLTRFLSSPERLYSIWDDTSPSWKGLSPLMVRGIPIAVKHWKKFYANFKNREVWAPHRYYWDTYEILMEEYASKGKEAFMNTWQGDNKMTASYKIVASLRNKKRLTDKEYVRRAYQDYPGEKFAELFSYRKGGETRLLTTPRAIAKRYLKLLEVRQPLEA